MKYVIKADDDIYIDVYRLQRALKYRFASRKMTILGLLQKDAKPVRNPISKWYVSYDEFPKDYYERFVSGWTYAATLDSVNSIVSILDTSSEIDNYFWIDDVHITGTLAQKAGVKRESVSEWYTLNSEHLQCCIDRPDNKDYYCDYLVGPSEKDLELMKNILIHAKHCYINSCIKSPPDKIVAKTCVNAKSPPLVPPGPGIGTIIKLNGR